ncbi:hypothetical protein C8J57DRAFT_1253003 [Mycena rebaudengoi]|nr:hypothetical protein C8J57DRAFT_1253003 [Mycena rebaudengoi]
MASLPQELVNYVVDQLDDYPSLNSCALVSTSFVAPAQQAIFHSLSIYTELDRRGHPTPPEASDSLTAFPHLAGYIRVLKIDIVHDNLEAEALNSILRAVRNLDRLIISGAGMRWTSIAPTLRMAIQDITTLPSLYGLHLVSIDDLPSQFIYRAASLVSVLSTHYVNLEQSGDANHPPNLISDVRLTHLLLSSFGPQSKALCDLFLVAASSYTARLARLSTFIAPDNYTYVSALLSAISPSLRHLSLGINKFTEPFDLPHLPLVCTLEVKLLDVQRNFYPSVQPALSTLATSFPNIALLTLVFVVSQLPPARRNPSLFLDIFPSFPDSTQLPHLREVHCQLLPRDRAHGVSSVFRYFRAAMDAQLSMHLPEPRILRCSLAEPARHFFRRHLPPYQVDLVNL